MEEQLLETRDALGPVGTREPALLLVPGKFVEAALTLPVDQA